MLGMVAAPMRPPLPTSWLSPKAVSWGERIERLKGELQREVGRLVRESVGGSVGMGMGIGLEEVLVRAVGQIVKMGEEGRK